MWRAELNIGTGKVVLTGRRMNMAHRYRYSQEVTVARMSLRGCVKKGQLLVRPDTPSSVKRLLKLERVKVQASS